MIIKVLGSGSKGNSTLIKIKNTNILIDAGLTLKSMNDRLNNEINNIDIIIITHVHDDHIKGLKAIIKKYKPIIYTNDTKLEEKINYPDIINTKFVDNPNYTIEFFELSHDEKCSGLLINDGNSQLVYITDTGYINNKLLEKIKNKNMYIFESNHDIEKLRNSKYPFYLQQRILSDKGHLSNDLSRKYLEKLIGINTKYIIMAHLSEENNTYELVQESINILLKKHNKVKAYIAKQNISLEEIEV